MDHFQFDLLELRLLLRGGSRQIGVMIQIGVVGYWRMLFEWVGKESVESEDGDLPVVDD